LPGAHLCLLLVIVLGMTAAGGVHLIKPDGEPRTVAPPDPAAPAQPEVATVAPARQSVTLRRHAVRLPGPGFVAWALLDRRTGLMAGSGNLGSPGDALSVIKPWLAADHLRRVSALGRTPTGDRLRQLRAVVRGEDNAATDALFAELGGAASIRRLVRRCGLTDTTPNPAYWSSTVVSARDTVRLGACLADGRAAGDRWTSWLLREMRRVRGTGDFGVRRALPAAVAARVAIRNGWLLRDEDSRWHVSCLAVDQGWVLGVLARYPARLGLRHGKRLCRGVGSQLIAH
jgi:hypothetical protein